MKSWQEHCLLSDRLGQQQQAAKDIRHSTIAVPFLSSPSPSLHLYEHTINMSFALSNRKSFCHNCFVLCEQIDFSQSTFAINCPGGVISDSHSSVERPSIKRGRTTPDASFESVFIPIPFSVSPCFSRLFSSLWHQLLHTS